MSRALPFSPQHLPQERSDDLTPLTDHNWVANILGMLGKAQTSSSLQDTHLEGATTRQSSRLPSAISPTTDEHIRASWTKATAPRTGTTPTSLLSDSRLLPQYGMSQSRSESSKALTISEPSPLSPLDPYSLGATRSWTGLGSRLEVLQLF